MWLEYKAPVLKLDGKKTKGYAVKIEGVYSDDPEWFFYSKALKDGPNRLKANDIVVFRRFYNNKEVDVVFIVRGSRLTALKHFKAEDKIGLNLFLLALFDTDLPYDYDLTR